MFAILLAWHVDLALKSVLATGSKASTVFVMAVPLLVGLQMVTSILPFSADNVFRLSTRRETDTFALADYVAEQSEPGDLVLSDYAAINFHANRASIYEASIIAGGRIRGGVITGELLVKRIEQDNVMMVLLHVRGGDPSPDHMVKLVDYETFRDYLAEDFLLLSTFDRAGQPIEVFKRRDEAND